jgi:hypothetical protein
MLARLLKGENVLAAAEHERVARNLGRRLGLADHVLLTDFSEIGREVGIIALTEESSFGLEESHHELPAAGMLTSAVGPKREKVKKEPTIDAQSDVLEAWALTSDAPSSVTLGSVIAPVRAAVGSSLDEQSLKISCPDPEIEIPLESTDLQILLINMLLACRDAVGTRINVNASLEVLDVDDSNVLKRLKRTQSVRCLVIYVAAKGEGSQIPVIGSYATCESLVSDLDGVLSASTARGAVSLQAHIPLGSSLSYDDEVRPRTEVVIVHPDSNVRQTISAALERLDVEWQAMTPEEFAIHKLDQHPGVIFADGTTLEDLHVLQPLSQTRLVEIVSRGAESVSHGGDTLRIPFALSDLQAHLQ